MCLNRYMPMIKNYSKGEGLLTFISEDIADMVIVLEYIGLEDDYSIDSAAPMQVVGDKLMLTTTSIVLLYKYGILGELNKYYEVYVLNGIVSKMKKEEKILLNEIKKESLKERFSLNNNNEEDNNYESLNRKLEHLNKIQNIVSDFIIIDIYKDMKENVISSIIPSYDVAAAEYAKKNKMQLVVDDAPTMGLLETFIGIERLTNTSGIVCKLLMTDNNFYDVLESLENMIKDKYLFSIDFKVLCFIIDKLIIDNSRDKLKHILNLLLKNDYDKQYYRLLNGYIEISPNTKFVECEIISNIIKEHENKKNIEIV